MKKSIDTSFRSTATAIFFFVLISGFSLHFNRCTPSKETRETMTPERRKAIEDSLLKVHKFEIMKYWSTGWEHYKNKSYADAKKYFLLILKLDPKMEFADEYKYRDIHGRLAQCYVKENKPDSTEWAFEEGLKFFPKNTYYLESLGYISRSKNAFDKAIMYYEKAIELQPDKADLYRITGELYYQIGNIDKAIEAYESYLKLKPEDRDAQEKYAAMLRSAGREEEALAQKEKLLAANPEDTALMFELGKAYYRKFENKKALNMLKRLVQREPENIDALQFMAGAQMNLELYDKAITTYKKINSLRPKDVEILCAIANAYRMKKSFVTARTWANRAHRADPKSGLPYITLGDIYAAAVEYCAGKKNTVGFDFDDKLVYELAYSQYQKAKQDPVQFDTATKLMKSLEPYLPTRQDKFMHPNQKKARGECYQWIYK